MFESWKSFVNLCFFYKVKHQNRLTIPNLQSIQKSRQSGNGRADVEINEDPLNQYAFLFWFNLFIKLRKTQNNSSDNDDSEDCSFEDDQESESQNVVDIDNMLDDDNDNGPHDDVDEEDEMNQKIYRNISATIARS